MSRSEEEIFQRLGGDGLLRVLDDVLDQTRLARLATACGLTYPGIRTRSQKRARILSDLVDRAGREEAARMAILRLLKKETAAAARSWSRLDPEERTRRLQDDGYLLSDGNLGQHIFLLASVLDGPEEDAILRKLCSRKDLRPLTSPAKAADAAMDTRTRKEISRLKKQGTELRKKIRHLENQLSAGRETEKALKKDLIRRKGDLAESRMLVEKLKRDLKESGPQSNLPLTAQDNGQMDKLSKAIRKLASEQRKLSHEFTKMTGSLSAPPGPAAVALPPVQKVLEELRKETAAIRKDRKEEAKQNLQRQEEIRDALRGLRSTAEPKPASARRSRRSKGERDRVGVFIDVQNMYYAARQLKGKLDFDALLQTAVLDRRLIQATAYLVESKEIDQSGFIAMLQQRAISVRRKTLKVRSDGSMKGDWDMEMALDILDAAPRLDFVVLVSGDGDFTSLVKRVKSMGPRVEVVGFPRNTAKSLLEAADRFQPLDRKFMIRSETRGPAARKSGKAESTRVTGSKPAASEKKEREAKREKDVKERATAAQQT